jgi:hypothetical protein
MRCAEGGTRVVQRAQHREQLGTHAVGNVVVLFTSSSALVSVCALGAASSLLAQTTGETLESGLRDMTSE